MIEQKFDICSFVYAVLLRMHLNISMNNVEKATINHTDFAIFYHVKFIKEVIFNVVMTKFRLIH